MKTKPTNRLGDRILIGLVFLFLYAPIFILIIFSDGKGDLAAGLFYAGRHAVIHNKLFAVDDDIL